MARSLLNKLSAALLAALSVQSLTASPSLAAAIVSKHVRDPASDTLFIVTCNPGPITADYAAETASGVKLTDPYAVKRGVDKGLVHLMNQGGRPTKRYTVAHGRIRAIVSLKTDGDILDRVDLLFTTTHVLLVHTATANAGIFTSSDVYSLPYHRTGTVDRTILHGQTDLLQTLALGLSFYDSPGHKCRPTGRPK